MKSFNKTAYFLLLTQGKLLLHYMLMVAVVTLRLVSLQTNFVLQSGFIVMILLKV